jgi:hypothetical protein
MTTVDDSPRIGDLIRFHDGSDLVIRYGVHFAHVVRTHVLLLPYLRDRGDIALDDLEDGAVAILSQPIARQFTGCVVEIVEHPDAIMNGIQFLALHSTFDVVSPRE